jgi:hypothetical protein
MNQSLSNADNKITSFFKESSLFLHRIYVRYTRRFRLRWRIVTPTIHNGFITPTKILFTWILGFCAVRLFQVAIPRIIINIFNWYVEASAIGNSFVITFVMIHAASKMVIRILLSWGEGVNKSCLTLFTSILIQCEIGPLLIKNSFCSFRGWEGVWTRNFVLLRLIRIIVVLDLVRGVQG